jgi:hypothetical protein
MKKSIYIFLAVFLSVLTFWGGSGVNAYFFCCENCRINRVDIIIGNENSCCDSHEEIQTANMIACADHRDECCGVNRISFAWYSDSNNQIDLQPLSIDLDHSIFLSAHEARAAIDILPLYHLLNRQSQIPPDLSKNDYFDLLCTLII